MAYIDDKNPKDLEDWTPLHCAAFHYRKEVCEFIASEIEDKNPVDKDGNTPMELWCQASTEFGEEMFGLNE